MTGKFAARAISVKISGFLILNGYYRKAFLSFNEWRLFSSKTELKIVNGKSTTSLFIYLFLMFSAKGDCFKNEFLRWTLLELFFIFNLERLC